MAEQSAEVVICGAGIAGVATAYELASVRGVGKVLLVEQGDPLALTSDKSTEAYRNWWPGPDDVMVRLINRSIDRLEQLAAESDNAIALNRRGYLYATADAGRLASFRAEAEQIAELGAGPLRVHSPDTSAEPYRPAPAHGFADQPAGADLIFDQRLIRAHFPYLSEATLAVLHVRRAGWFSARQLGMLLLERARASGVQLVRGQLIGVEREGGRVVAVQVATAGGIERIATSRFVSAAGPLQGAVGQMLGVELPLYNELHLKVAFDDRLGVVPRHAPMLICADPVSLDWEAAERVELLGDPALRWLLNPLPSGVHGRPEGGADAATMLLLRDYHTPISEPHFPIAIDPQLSELVLRGMARMIPGLAAYAASLPRAYIDGGYYTRTRENRPLIGPLPVAGAFIIGGLSGFGVMAACAAAELLAAQICGEPLPSYAPAFSLARYSDLAYLRKLEQWGDVGQL